MNYYNSDDACVIKKNMIFRNQLIYKINTLNKFYKINFFFNFIDNKLYIKYNYIILSIDLFYNFFFKKKFNNLVLLFPTLSYLNIRKYFLTNSLKFNININKELLWFVFIEIINFLKKNMLGYKIKLKFLGLGFNVIKLSDNIFKFFLASSVNIYMFVPNYIKMQYIINEKSIVIFGLEPNYVNNIASIFLLLLNISVYRIFGIVRLGKIIRLKIGKKR